MSDPLSIAANVIALLQLTAVTIEYLKGIKNGAADRLHLRDELRSTACLLEMLRDRIEDAEDADLRSESTEKVLMKSLVGSDSPLILFQRMLEEIIAKLSPQDKLRQRSLPLMWPFTKKDIAEKLSSIERLKSHISLAMQSDLVELAQSSHHKIINLGQKMDRTDARFQDDETQKVILWLSPLFFREQHVAILESVQPDTGVWFVQHESFRSWVHGDTNLLWCPGLPGAGKTRLMSIAVDLLEHHEKIPINSLCTYIYCNYERQKEQTSAALLSSILQQILQHSTSDTMPLEVLSLYNSHKKYGTRPTLTQLSDLFIKLASAFETLFVVIDALDECAESEEEALQLLSIIRSIGPQVKILCSSRFSTTFEAYFASTEKLEIYAQTKDIRLFLDSGIGLQSRLSKHVRADPSLKAHIIDSITEECKGMFLLAKLHLESLSTKINRKAVRSSLRTLPASLDDTYSEALRRIYDQSSDAVALAETVLFWVICASQPLTVMQLQHMYATKELTDDMPLEIDDLPDADILTAACGGLITVDNESQTIHAIHYTVQQYFERSFSQKLVAAKTSVTKVSLAYLTLPNFSSGFCTTDADMLDRLTQYPFLEYAAKNWGSSAGCLEADELLAYLRRFCSSPAAIEMTSQVWSLPDSRFNNWSQEFPRKSPALVLAAAFELPVILRQMIEDGHEIEGKGTDQETALMRASALGHTNNVRVLLRLGAVANARDYMGESALQKAALNGHECVVRSLLEGGADATNKASSDWTPLMSAVCSGNIDIVRLLVEAGAETMAETVWGDSALSMAVRSSQGAIANFLVDHGAILPCGTVRRSAFTPASCRGSNKLVEHFTVDYEAIAGKTMHRRSSRDMKRLPGLLQETPGSMPGSQAEAQGNDEISFAEFIEQYNFKTNFSQKYILKQQLGTGHSSEVFACFNKVTSVLFAVKIISRNETLKSSRLSQALKNEFQVLRELQKRPHPNLLGLVDLFAEYEQNRICVVQDLAPDGELFNLIVAKQKLTETETRTISTQLFSAVGFLHDQGWVHRDIKPENILVVDEKSLAIKLGDFGLATRLRKETGFDEPATTLCGTPSYMAPEVLQTSSKRRYGYPVDVWSCGVALYICLAGFPPFSDELRTGKNPFDLVQQIKMGHFDYPSPYWDSIGDLALNLIDQMLCVDLRNRLTIQECTSHPWMLNESSSSSKPANETSLYLAASDGAIDKMRRQLIEGAAVMAADNRGWTPLAIASSRGHTGAVKLLLEKGADKMVQTKTLLTPLHLACYRGRVEVTRLLLESGANLEAKSENGSTPLLFALKMGHLEVTRMLLEKGVDVTVADDRGWTPLAVASSTGHVEAVELLLENGADMMVRCEALLTPLHLACHYGRVEVVKLLLEKGADAAAIEAGGCTPLHYVSEGDIFEDAHIQASKLLLRHPGVSIEAQDNNLRTPLYLAATRGHIKAVRLYLEQGAAVYVKDRYRSTPLAAAVRNGHAAVVQLLLATDGVHNDFEDLGQTLLWWAKKSGNVRAAELVHQRAQRMGFEFSESELNMGCEPVSWERVTKECDVCCRPVRSAYYHCTICGGSNFDICLECAERGFECQDASHKWSLRE